MRRGSPRAVFDTSLVGIRRARAAQIGSTSCPVARRIVRAVAPRDTSSSPAPRGVSGRAPRRNPAFRAAPQGCGDACVFGGWSARARARRGRRRAPGTRRRRPAPPARVDRALERVEPAIFLAARALLGDRGLVRLGPPEAARRGPGSTRFVRLPPIPPTPRADVSSDLSPPQPPSRSSRTHRISRPGRLLARFWGRPREPTEDRGGRLSLPLAIIPFVAAALHQLNSPSLLEDDADLFSRRLSRPPRAARVRAPRVLAALRAPPPPRDRREGVSLPRVARV